MWQKWGSAVCTAASSCAAKLLRVLLTATPKQEQMADLLKLWFQSYSQGM